MAKREIIGAELEYTMSSEMYEALRDEAPKNVGNYREWVIDYINETFGLLGTVTTLHVEGENIRRK
jgi:hypothetical protein